MHMRLEEIDANGIKAIMEVYGIPDFDIPDKININLKGKLSKRIAFVLDSGINAYAHYDSKNEELALLIRFLRICKGSDIELKGIVQKTQGKRIKNTEMTARVSASNQFITWLEMFVNTWLERQQDGLYQYEFGWDFKEPLTICRGLAPVFEKEQHPFFTGPYTDEELNNILEYENKAKKVFPKFKGYAKLGRMVWKIKTLLEPYKLSMTQTKLYSFIYDVMLLGKCVDKNESITEEGFSSNIGREKYSKVRYWLSAYKTAENKFLSNQKNRP